MKKVALAAFSAATLACGAAQAAITLDMTFSDESFGISGHFYGAFDSLPANESIYVTSPSVTCDVEPSANYVCEGAFVSHTTPTDFFLSGIQINVGGDTSVGLAFSFDRDTLITPGVYQNTNGYDFGHRATLTVTNSDYSPPPGPGVPEPATWALMLAGFFGAGAALRRRTGAFAA